MLEEALAEFPAALVVRTIAGFDHVATGIPLSRATAKSALHEGNYSDYLERTKGEAKKPTPKASADRKTQSPSQQSKRRGGQNRTAQNQSKPRKLTFAEQNELAKMEENILAAESEAEALSQKLSDPSVYKDHATDAWLGCKSRQKRADIERLYARWQELESLAAQSKK